MRIIFLISLLITVFNVEANKGWFCRQVGEYAIGGPPTIKGDQVVLNNLTSGTYACIFETKEYYEGDEGFVLSLQGGKMGMNMVGIATRSDFVHPVAFCDGHYYNGDTKNGNLTLQKYFGDPINFGHGEKEDIAFRVNTANNSVRVYIKHSMVTLGKAYDFPYSEHMYPVVCLSENATAAVKDLSIEEVIKIKENRDESTPRGTYKIEKYLMNNVSAHLTCKNTFNLTTVYYGITKAKTDLLFAEKIAITFGTRHQLFGYMKYTHNKWSFEIDDFVFGECIDFLRELLTNGYDVDYPTASGKLMYIDVKQNNGKRRSFQAFAYPNS